MINAAIVGLGWWGQTLVESVSGSSSKIRFVAGVARRATEPLEAFTREHGLAFVIYGEYSQTPISMRCPQRPTGARGSGRAAPRLANTFREKPFALPRRASGRGGNRKQADPGLGTQPPLHPEMTKLRDQIGSGKSARSAREANRHFPMPCRLPMRGGQSGRNTLRPDHPWVHAWTGYRPRGEIDEVIARVSARRGQWMQTHHLELFRMKAGMSGYLATMTATGGGFSFQVFGSKGFVRLEGMTHIAGAPSEERRKRCFGNCYFKPVKGPLQSWEADKVDIVKAVLDQFADAVDGTQPFIVPTQEMIHGAAVTETIVKSAASHQIEKVI